MLEIDLKGTVALITGGSRGIGAGITELFCRAGARVYFTHTGSDKRRAAVAKFVARLTQAGGSVTAVASDATDAGATAELIDRIVRENGRIDVLVTNVGQNLAGPAEKVSDEQWRRFIDINLSSAFYAVRGVLPHMLAASKGRRGPRRTSSRRGTLIFIGSSAVVDGGGGAIDYAAAKAGLDGMMKYLCRNYARRGIVANVIHPSAIETDLLKERYRDPEKRKQLVGQVPVGRLGQPEDVAALAAYLASPLGGFVCGQSILVDGGRMLFG